MALVSGCGRDSGRFGRPPRGQGNAWAAGVVWLEGSLGLPVAAGGWVRLTTAEVRNLFVLVERLASL